MSKRGEHHSRILEMQVCIGRRDSSAHCACNAKSSVKSLYWWTALVINPTIVGHIALKQKEIGKEVKLPIISFLVQKQSLQKAIVQRQLVLWHI